MGALVSRVKALGLPLDEVVVIGSGLLDAYGIRDSRDIDLVVSEPLFNRLKASGQYRVEHRYDSTTEVLLQDDIEIWTDWGAADPFESLSKDAVEKDGVRFAAPRIIMEHKKQRGSDKDLNDIRLLQEYLHGRK